MVDGPQFPRRRTQPMQCAWEMAYSASRRKHNHRCQGCRRIVQDGERVWMARVANRCTRVVHTDCADTPVSEARGEAITALELMELHAQDHLGLL